MQEIINPEEIKVVKTKIESMAAQVDAIKVTSPEELTQVANHISNVKKMRKYVEQERDKYIAPAKEIIAKAKDQYDPYVKACDEAEAALKGKAQSFMLEQKKKEDDEKARILADGRTKVETKVEKLSEVKEAPKTVETLSMKMVKDVRIIDQAQIPDEYYKPRELDMVKIKKVATAGVVIPGVEVYEKPQMASR